jgi:3',5'-cyclic AMP phosphodiesterase CpdA
MSFNSARRSFLKRAALFCGATAMAKPHNLFADEQPRESTAEPEDVWALVTDMHLSDGTNPPPEYNVRFQSVITSMLAEPVKPQRLLLLGDNVDDGTSKQYQRLLDLLRPVVMSGIGIHASLGNHDHRERFREIREQLLPAPEKRDKSITHIVRTEPLAEGEDKHLEILETKRANFFVLDSLIKTHQREGQLGKHQLDWLAAELDRRKDKPAILIAHHPAVNAGANGLADAIPLWHLLGSRHQVKAYFFGHTHIWTNYRLGRIHQIGFPATSRCSPLTVLGWVLMTLYDDGVRLTLKTCNPAHPRNEESVHLKWS